MKTISKLTMAVVFTAFVLIAAQSASAADIKNWPKWMQPKKPSPPAVSTLAAPAKAMDCTQCTSATEVVKHVLVAGKPAHGFRYVTRTVHKCGGCRDTLARKSGMKSIELTHDCTAVGQKAQCCDTSRTTGRRV